MTRGLLCKIGHCTNIYPFEYVDRFQCEICLRHAHQGHPAFILVSAFKIDPAMATQSSAASVLEFLTHRNPTVHHLPPNSLSNTHDVKYYWPREVKKWDQFKDLDVFKSAFRGRLFEAARRTPGKPLHYPYYKDEIDCGIRDEKKTKTLLDKWNHSIVTQALEEVNEFRPSYWVNDDPIASAKDPELPLSPISGERSGSGSPPVPRRQPSRKCAKGPSRSSRRRRVPDAGSAVLVGELSPSADADSRERFPKEYKPAGKWSSDKSLQQNLLSRGGEPHRWERSWANRAQAWPIRQAFTYCVINSCRYGCILTCKEAFIFQIQPIEQDSGTFLTQNYLCCSLLVFGLTC